MSLDGAICGGTTTCSESREVDLKAGYCGVVFVGRDLSGIVWSYCVFLRLLA